MVEELNRKSWKVSKAELYAYFASLLNISADEIAEFIEDPKDNTFFRLYLKETPA